MTNTSPVQIVDCTLTAGQAALWGGIMTNEMLLPILPRLDRAGFKTIELLDPFVFTACAQRLAEDPWERLRLAAKRLSHTPASVSLAGQYLFGSRPVEKKVIRRAIRLLAQCGVTRVDCYDPLNDVETLQTIIEECKDLGLFVCTGIVYALGDAYDDMYFSSKAENLAALECDALALVDFAGILHPERAPSLVTALARSAGKLPLELRTHCRSSRAEIACFVALDNGVSALHAASEPLSGGVSVPSTDFFCEHLTREGYRSAVDAAEVAAISDYFAGIAEYHALPQGAPVLYDVANDADQLPTVLHETNRGEFTRLRTELGDPPLALPVAAWLCGAHDIADVREKMRVDKTVDKHAGEDQLTALHLSEEAMRAFMFARRDVDRSGWDMHADSPQSQLLAELARRPWIREIIVESRA